MSTFIWTHILRTCDINTFFLFSLFSGRTATLVNSMQISAFSQVYWHSSFDKYQDVKVANDTTSIVTVWRPAIHCHRQHMTSYAHAQYVIAHQ